jgi:hypothetical protein
MRLLVLLTSVGSCLVHDLADDTAAMHSYFKQIVQLQYKAAKIVLDRLRTNSPKASERVRRQGDSSSSLRWEGRKLAVGGGGGGLHLL